MSNRIGTKLSDVGILNLTGAFEDEVAGSFIRKSWTESETESLRECVQINNYTIQAGGRGDGFGFGFGREIR